ncbi:MAG: hypothetical protein HC905_04545, partial [Bacteroidales bacterium]|nr:hypothetical protein [Bacteroidales bacterium]
VNFGDRDRWWGCLANGFHEPVYGMPYNFPYYKDLFEAYGFKNYFNQYTYHHMVNLEGVRPEVVEKAERIFKIHYIPSVTWRKKRLINMLPILLKFITKLGLFFREWSK